SSFGYRKIPRGSCATGALRSWLALNRTIGRRDRHCPSSRALWSIGRRTFAQANGPGRSGEAPA
ncbi:hypothetical protein RLK13_08350, partial [Streptococcus pneumoniae]|nr:hypothetical protein [Streptococcus pneumoniae]